MVNHLLMPAMNRLAPLIVRRHAPVRAAYALPAVAVTPAPAPGAAGQVAGLDDLRLFLTGWIGGLIFFGTLLS